MRTIQAKQHLFDVSVDGTTKQREWLDALKLPKNADMDTLFTAFCSAVDQLSIGAQTLAVLGIFGDDDAPHVMRMVRRYANPEKQPCAAGWWVGRLVDFDSKIIPRSRHDDQDKASPSCREIVEFCPTS